MDTWYSCCFIYVRLDFDPASTFTHSSDCQLGDSYPGCMRTLSRGEAGGGDGRCGGFSRVCMARGGFLAFNNLWRHRVYVDVAEDHDKSDVVELEREQEQTCTRTIDQSYYYNGYKYWYNKIVPEAQVLHARFFRWPNLASTPTAYSVDGGMPFPLHHPHTRRAGIQHTNNAKT